MKKQMTALLVFVLLGLLMPLATAFASPLPASEFVGIVPATTVSIEMETSADATLEVDAGDVVSVTVRWRRAFAATSEPIAVWTTNGAAVNTGSITFAANGIPGQVNSIVTGDGVVRFTTGAPVNPPLLNSVSFDIIAPQGGGSFTLSVKVGLETASNSPFNFAERTFAVNPNLTLTTNSNIVIGSEQFNVDLESGFVSASGFDFMYALEFIHPATGQVITPAGELTGFLNPDGSFSSDFTFMNTAPEGEYNIKVQILELSSFESMGSAQTTIELVWPAPSITISSSLAVAEDDEPFIISGEMFNLDNPDIAAVRILNSSGNVIHEDTTGLFNNDMFSFNSFSFSDHHAAGIYHVEVELLFDNWQQTLVAEITIEHIKPPPTVPTMSLHVMPDNTSFTSPLRPGRTYGATGTVLYPDPANSMGLPHLEVRWIIRVLPLDINIPIHDIYTRTSVVPTNGIINLGNRTFTTSYIDGLYVIIAEIYDSNGNFITREHGGIWFAR